MSNALAVTAVTATLRNLLIAGLADEIAGGKVTTKPLDKARDTNGAVNQVNLFLYNVSYDAAWLNMSMPNQIKPNETAYPPLPLVLHYLITAYGENDDAQAPVSHTLLGTAMRVLHDHPLLGADEIKAALIDSDLGDQIERVRITPQPMSVEEMSKLWTTFQTNYRISAAYQVSVVLIESTRTTKTPLPVLTRGPNDSGVRSQPDLTPVCPTLTAVKVQNNQPSARLGDTITLEGFHLDGNTITAQFKHPRLENIVTVTPVGGTATKLEIKIPDDAPQNWACGIYSISLLIKRAGKQNRVTNELPFALAPVITSTPLPLSVVRDADDSATIELTCAPQVLPEQRVMLLLSDKDARQFPAEPRSAQTDSLKFIIENAPVNNIKGFFIRLRVDGVDSLLVANYAATKPAFDKNQKVKIV